MTLGTGTGHGPREIAAGRAKIAAAASRVAASRAAASRVEVSRVAALLRAAPRVAALLRSAPAVIAAAVAAASLAPSAATAQVFGQYTTAAVSPLGEGAVFFSAGGDRTRAGLVTRFLITGRSDLGVQAGYARTEQIDNYGVGVDYKIYMVDEDPTTRVDLSADVSLGWLGGSGYSSGILTVAFLVSGMLDPYAVIRIEPYGSVGFMGQHFFSKGDCGERRPGGWPCERDDWSSDSNLILRGGAKVWLSDEYHVLVELDYVDHVTLGVAFNVVF